MKGIWTANSSALLEWRNKLIQHYMADREDEYGQPSASGILVDLESWPVVKAEGWERGRRDNASRPVYVSYYGTVLSSAWDNAA